MTGLAERLRAVSRELAIPGAAVAVLRDGVLTKAATGVTNLNTRLDVTDHTLFLIGSVTKPITASLIRGLAEEGRINLEAPVTRYLRGLRLAGRPAPTALRVRHLLDHSGGIDGDFFTDTGRNPDALAKYVDACSDLPILAEPGRYFSYCNAGYVLLGRIAEIVTGQVWDEAVSSRVLAPAGAGPIATLPEELLKYRAAVGHSNGLVTDRTTLPRSLGPAGFTLAMTATGLVRFMAKELATRRINEPTIRLPDGTYWGSGWKIQDMGGARLVGHDGGAAGQGASLWAAPDCNIIVAVVHNGNGGALHDRLVLPIIEDITGCARPSEPIAQGAFDIAHYAGIYQNVGMRLQIEYRGGRLQVVGEHLQFPAPPAKFDIDAIDKSRFLARPFGNANPVVMAFLDFDRGCPRHFWAGRLYPRVDLPAA